MSELKLQLPDETIEICQKRIDGTDFDSIHEYLSFIITEVVERDTNQQAESKISVDEEQLKSLGYI